MPKKLGAAKKVSTTPAQPDRSGQYRARIQQLEQELQSREEENLLKDEVSYRREILVVLNRIAAALEEGESDQAGDEPDEKYLPELPDPEPEQASEDDF